MGSVISQDRFAHILTPLFTDLVVIDKNLIPRRIACSMVVDGGH